MIHNWKLLESLREANGYTYKEISYLMNCSTAYVWQLCNGKRNLTYQNAVLFAEIFNTTPDDIFYGECKNNNKMMKKINFIRKQRNRVLANKKMENNGKMCCKCERDVL